MNLTYSKYAENFILEALDLELDEAGYVLHEEDGYVGTVCGKDCLRIDKVGAYTHDEDAPGDTLLMCDHISCIAEHSIEQDSEEWEDPRNP